MANPSNSQRLSRAEAKLIRVGLKQIVAAQKFYERHGQTPGIHLRSLYPGPHPDSGKYNLQHMSLLRRALTKIQSSIGNLETIADGFV
jgi:hypothetical protein